MLGLREGLSENATVTTGLLDELVERGLRADRRRLFVIDGAKALRSAIGHVLGKGTLVQRCGRKGSDPSESVPAGRLHGGQHWPLAAARYTVLGRAATLTDGQADCAGVPPAHSHRSR